MLWVWTGILCGWTLPPTCHLLLPEPWAHVPKETREHRDLLVVTELALSASLPLHCAIWCMALITALCQACFSPMYGGKSPFREPRSSTYPFCFCYLCEASQVVFQLGTRRRDQSQSISNRAMRVLMVYITSALILSNPIWWVIYLYKRSTFKSALLLDY